MRTGASIQECTGTASSRVTMDLINTVLSALAEPTRRQALALLWQGRELCVCELMQFWA